MTASFFSTLDRLDELLALGPRAVDFVMDVRPLLLEPAARTYFFDKIAEPGWIAQLDQAGEFSGSGSFQDHHPQFHYLSRMAALVPETVLPVLLSVTATDPWIHAELVDAAIKMPTGLSAQLARRESAWILQQRLTVGLLPGRFGTLASHCAKGAEAEAALRLCHALLRIIPDSQAASSGLPSTCIEDWDYQQLLEDVIPDVETAAPEATLRLLCDLLNAAMEVSLTGDETPSSDLSTSWRSAVEESDQDLSPTLIQGVRGLLVSAIRDAAQRAISSHRLPAGFALYILERYGRWQIFGRLALHILRLYPAGLDDVITQRLVDRKHFAHSYDLYLLHEYALLFRDHFRQLPQEQQATLLNWIDEGPDTQMVSAHMEQLGRPFTAEDAAYFRKRWQLNRLALVSNDLSSGWRSRYDDLVFAIGASDHPEFQSYSSGIESGPNSPLSAKALSELSIAEIVDYVSAFQATWKQAQAISEPAPAGLGQALAEAVSQSPERFARDAVLFRELSSTYVRSLLVGLNQAMRQERWFTWDRVLHLCSWVVSQPRATNRDEAVTTLAFLSGDSDWLGTRQEIASLLESGFEPKEGELPFSFRETVWAVLSRLVEDPDPDQTYEARYLQGMGAATASLNTVRGRALHAIVRYGLWAQRHLKTLQGDAHVIAQGLQPMPEVREVLESHLEITIDPSLAIRSVYGRWFAWLNLLDPMWTTSWRPRIFPAEEALREYWSAAWSAYVVFSPAYDNVFEVLKDEYAVAVERIGSTQAKADRADNVDRRLAEHIALMYGRGKVSLQPTGLVHKFFAKGGGELRGHLLETVGRILKNQPEPLTLEINERLRALWEFRLNTARLSSLEHEKELRAFSWWLTSGKFAPHWSLKQLRDVLEIAGGVDLDNVVVKYLADVASEQPLLALECLRLMIQGDGERWHVHRWKDSARKVLEIARLTGRSDVLPVVAGIANQLGALGFFEFRTLR